MQPVRVCARCRHFKSDPHEDPELAKCALYGAFSLVSGRLLLDLASDARREPSKCGLAAVDYAGAGADAGDAPSARTVDYFEDAQDVGVAP